MRLKWNLFLLKGEKEGRNRILKIKNKEQRMVIGTFSSSKRLVGQYARSHIFYSRTSRKVNPLVMPAVEHGLIKHGLLECLTTC